MNHGKRGTPEGAVLRQVLQLLALRGVFHWRQNQGAIPLEGGGYRAFVGMRGVPDILAVRPGGKLVGIEVKSPVGKLRKEQRAFRDRLRALGGVYLVIRDPRELDAWLMGKVLADVLEN
jgi:hypothetical protein